MRSAIIDNGLVVNVIMGRIPGSVSCNDAVSPGWGYDGTDFIAPPSPEPEPQPSPLERRLNRIQFEFMLEKLGITDAISAAIDAMPETTEAERNEKILARVLFRSGQEFVRDHPLFTQLAPAIGMTPQQIDAAWIEAAQLTW